MVDTNWNPLRHHRGPFRLQVLRLTPKRKQPWHTETLSGSVPAEDVADEAQALLTDPRDTIQTVFVFSESEQQFVTAFKRKEPDLSAAIAGALQGRAVRVGGQ